MEISKFLEMTGHADFATARAKLEGEGNTMAVAMLDMVKAEYEKAYAAHSANAYLSTVAAVYGPVIPAFTAPVTITVTYDGNGGITIAPRVDGDSLSAITSQVDAALKAVELPENCGKFRLISVGGKVTSTTASTAGKTTKTDGTTRERTATNAVWSVDGGQSWVTAKHAYELLRGAPVTDTREHNYVPDVIKFVVNSETDISVMLAGTAHPDTLKEIAGNARFVVSDERPAVKGNAKNGVYEPIVEMEVKTSN